MKEEEFEFTQKAEEDSWNLGGDLAKIEEKASRERARYPLLVKQMGLKTCIDTSNMFIMEVGVGPLGGISSILPHRKRTCIEPLTDKYAEYYDTTGYVNMKAEDLKRTLSEPDLIIATNCIDHFKEPLEFLEDLDRYMKYGAYFAHFHAINNAITHKHPAHKHNLNELIFKQMFSKNFELVWEMNYKDDGLVYGWTKQKSFLGLYRRINEPNF